MSRPDDYPQSVIADYDLGYFPADVERAYLEITWYLTDDFTIHYSEQYSDKSQPSCRWDRHPKEHNTRGYFHPPPNAKTPGDDASFPEDFRDVMSLVLRELDARIESFWA